MDQSEAGGCGLQVIGKENMFHYSIPGPAWEHRNRINRWDTVWSVKVNSK